MLKKTIFYLLFTTLFFGLSPIAEGQVISDYDDISIFFGDKQKSNSNIERFIKTKSNDLLCVQNQMSFFNIFSRNNSQYTFDFITDYTLPDKNATTFYGNGKKSSLTHYTILGDYLLGVSSQTSFLNKEPQLFYHFINPYAEAKTNHGFPLSDVFFYDKITDLSQLTLVSSQDKSFASIIYTPESAPNEHTNIRYLNFDGPFAHPHQRSFIFPYPTKDYELLDFYIKDAQTQFLIAGHYIKKRQKNVSTAESQVYQSVTVGKISAKGVKYEEIKSEEKLFTEVNIYTTQEGLLLSGLYTSYIDGNIEGIFTAQLSDSGKAISPVFTPFSAAIKTSIDRYNTDFLNDYNTLKNEYIGFDLLHLQSHKDEFIGFAEFNALEYRYGGTDVPGATNTIDSYFWSNDIIVFKLDSNRQIKWNRVIPKHQRSINDGGYYLSTAPYLEDKNLHLFFNDSQLNYDTDRDYNKNGDQPFSTQFNSSKNTIAHVQLRLSDGFVERKSTIGKEETDLIFVPILSTSFPITNKLMIYGRSGNKHRIGSVSFHK